MKRKAPRGPVATPNLPERIEQLRVKRQEIIRPILEHPREYVLLSVRSMAQRLKTDPATVVRIVRGLGFASYRDFQHHLHELSLAFASPVETMQTVGRDSNMQVFVRESLAQNLKNLQGLKNSLDGQRLTDLAKRFYGARRIVIFAGDIAATLAEYLEYQISVLGLPIFAAISAGAITHLARVLTKRDLVIAISFRRGLRQTIEGAQQARAHGAYCVGISDTYLSPLANATKCSWRRWNRPRLESRMLRRFLCSTRSLPPAGNIGVLSHSRWLERSPKNNAKASAGTALNHSLACGATVEQRHGRHPPGLGYDLRQDLRIPPCPKLNPRVCSRDC